MVIGQNYKLGWRKVLKEVLIVLTCIKPGVDAWRVASDTEIVEGHVMGAKTEMTATKVRLNEEPNIPPSYVTNIISHAHFARVLPLEEN